MNSKIHNFAIKGMSIEQARKKILSVDPNFNIVEIEDKRMIGITMDFRPNRVRLFHLNGVVTKDTQNS